MDRLKGSQRTSERRNSGSTHAHGVNEQKDSSAEEKFKDLGYNPDWMTKGADENLVKFAEEAGKFMASKGLTNSKIRSVYEEIKRIQMGGFNKEKASFYLLKPKMAYVCAREKKNGQNKNEGLYLFKMIFDRCWDQVKDKTTFTNFCNLFEAILAYHKANGGKD